MNLLKKPKMSRKVYIPGHYKVEKVRGKSVRKWVSGYYRYL